MHHDDGHPHISGSQLFWLGTMVIVGYYAMVAFIIIRAQAMSAETAAAMAMGTLNLAGLAGAFFFGASLNRKRDDSPTGTPSDPISTTVDNAPSAPVPVEQTHPEDG